MIIGTPNFETLGAAYTYYKVQGLTPQDVDRKLAEGEIFIGRPKCHKTDRLFTREGRYYYEENGNLG